VLIWPLGSFDKRAEYLERANAKGTISDIRSSDEPPFLSSRELKRVHDIHPVEF
jgi:hypothetical protein